MGPAPDPGRTLSPALTPTVSVAKPAAAADDPLIGRVLSGRYAVLQRLGEGASGAVYLAEHVVLQRRVALKVMRAQHSGDAELLSRFRREARAASAVRHPGVVEVTDFGETGEGIPYIVMEWVDGETLAKRLDRTGPLPASEGCRLLAEVASAAVAAHRLGVIHRDLKPENLLIAPGGHVKVGDFGLCAWGDAAVSRLTMDGQVFGTPYYMATEQVEGLPATEQCDVYALGCIIFEALTGRTVFGHRGAVAVLHAHVHEPPPRLADIAEQPVPPDLDELVSRCLAKRPEDRPSMTAAMATLEAHSRLTRLDFVTPLTDHRIPHQRGATAWLRGPRCLAAIAGATAGLVLAGVWGSFFPGGVRETEAHQQVESRVTVVRTAITPPEELVERAAEVQPEDEVEGEPISVYLPIELVSPEPLVVSSTSHAPAAPSTAQQRRERPPTRPPTPAEGDEGSDTGDAAEVQGAASAPGPAAPAEPPQPTDTALPSDLKPF